jgi:competence protein ComEC
MPAAALSWVAAWMATIGTARAVGAAGGLCAAAAASVLIVAGRRQVVPQAAMALALTAVVLAAAWADLSVRATGPAATWARARATAAVAGRVAQDPRPVPPGPYGGPQRWAVPLDAVSISARGYRAPARGPVTVLGTGGWARARVGDRLAVTGRLLPPLPGDTAVAGLVAEGQPRLVRRAAWPWRLADRLRGGLRRACAGLGRDAAGLLPALVVGDTSAMPDDLRVALRAGGLTHLTAVSGANLTIITAAAVGGASALGLPRRARLGVAAAGLVGFVVLARPQPSVLRAAVMGGVGMLGLAAGRSGRGMPALCAAVVGLLCVDPWLSRAYGFALSVLATSGLLILVPPLVAVLVRRRVPRPAAVSIALPTAAQLATAPVTVLLNPSLSLVAVPANLLVAPAVAPATVLGVAAAVLSSASGAAAHLVALPAAAAAQWIALVARTAAAVPAGSLPWIPGVPGALLLATTIALALLVLGAGRRRSRRCGSGAAERQGT